MGELKVTDVQVEASEGQTGPVLEHELPQLSVPKVVWPQEGVGAEQEPLGVHVDGDAEQDEQFGAQAPLVS